jgi:hypothetical protein
MKKLPIALFFFIALVVGAITLPAFNVIIGDVQSAYAFTSGGGGEGGCGGCGGGEGGGEGGSGGGEASDPKPPQPPMNPPVCTLDGTQVTLSWGSIAAADSYPVRIRETGNPATERAIDNLTSTSYTFSIQPNTTYQWWVHSYDSSNSPEMQKWSDSTQVSFECSYTEPTPVCDDFTAAPTTIIRGDSSTLNWSTSNAIVVGINGGIGGVAFNGTTSVSPLVSRTYTLTAFNSVNESVSCITEVIVQIPGCTDATATNYNPNATVDDNSCTFPVPGCTDVNASNYNPNATVDDNSCTFPVPGCTDAAATNYNPNATVDDNSCTFPVPGCTDVNASNYNPNATVDDNSCTFPIPGCTDPVATNYNPNATVDDNSCTFPVPAPTCDDFTASPASIVAGDESILNWETTNATRVAIDGGVGDVTLDGAISVSPLATTTYTLTASNSINESVSCMQEVNVTAQVVPGCIDPLALNFDATATVDDGSCAYPTPPPTCDAFSATPASIVVGNSSTLTWETTNAVRVVINGGIGDVNVDGSTPVTPLATNIYTLTAFNAANESVSCAQEVIVTPLVIPGCTDATALNYEPLATVNDGSCTYAEPLPICDTFTASPATIVVGSSSTIAWETTNATRVAIDGGVGDVTLDGSTSVSPLTTTTYILTASNTDNESVSCVQEVAVTTLIVPGCTDSTALNFNPVATVNNGSCIYPDPVPVCTTFQATPNSLPIGGGSVVLDWAVVDATGITIAPTIGTAPLSLVGSKIVNVTQSTNYILTATGVSGAPVTCSAPVIVVDPTPAFTCANNVSFTASATTIKPRQSVTLNWSTSKVDSVTISNLNLPGLSGSKVVAPEVTSTYVLTAVQGTKSIDCSLKINVSTGGGGGGGSTPRCELDISKSKIDQGEEITLSWEAQSTRKLALTDDQGNTLVTTDDRLSKDKEELFNSEITLTPTQDTTYTLLVERGRRDRECTVDVEVEEKIVLLQVRDQSPLVSGISLAQVPYTGFEAGPVMTILFYMLLVIWALYITYVLVIPKAHFAVVPINAFRPRTNPDLMADAETVRPDVFATMSVAPIATVPVNLPVATPIAPVVPVNLPVATAVVPVVTEVIDTHTIENQAHGLQALISSDAVRTIAGMVNGADQTAVVAQIVADAKGAFPLEDGWVVINQSRLMQITNVAPVVVSTAPTGAGSLAEAVVTGNIVAAYSLIVTRPMIALADAAADLDALYRIRKGADAKVSDLLTAKTADLTDEQISEMITALTGALDGMYTDEASAVKMAIMKAVKVAA